MGGTQQRTLQPAAPLSRVETSILTAFPKENNSAGAGPRVGPGRLVCPLPPAPCGVQASNLLPRGPALTPLLHKGKTSEGALRLLLLPQGTVPTGWAGLTSPRVWACLSHSGPFVTSPSATFSLSPGMVVLTGHHSPASLYLRVPPTLHPLPYTVEAAQAMATTAMPASNLPPPPRPVPMACPHYGPSVLKPTGTLSLTSLARGPTVPQDALLKLPMAGPCIAVSLSLGSPSSRKPPVASPSPVAACLAPAALHTLKLLGSGCGSEDGWLVDLAWPWGSGGGVQGPRGTQPWRTWLEAPLCGRSLRESPLRPRHKCRKSPFYETLFSPTEGKVCHTKGIVPLLMLSGWARSAMGLARSGGSWPNRFPSRPRGA